MRIIPRSNQSEIAMQPAVPLQNEGPSRVYWMDLARVLAAFGVVMVHVSGRTVVNPRDFGTLDWWASIVYNGAGRWSVPVFIMMSGALLLPQAARTEAGAFILRRSRRILIPLVAWTALYLTYTHFRVQHLTFETALRRVATGAPYYHLWYLYAAFGLYLVSPGLVRIINRLTLAEKRAAALILTLVAAAWTAYSTWFPIREPMAALYLWAPFLGPYLAGYLWPTKKPGKANVILHGLLIAAYLACIAMASYLLKGHVKPESAWLYFLRFLSPTALLLSVSVVEVLRGLPLDRLPEAWLTRIHAASTLTLGVYLLHPIFLLELNRRIILIDLLPQVLSIPLATLLIVFLSGGAAYLMSRVPLVRTIS